MTSAPSVLTRRKSHARSVEAAASASMGGGAVCARSVAEQVSASMGGSAINARSVEAAASVSMDDNAVDARSVEGQASFSMGGGTVNARSVLVLLLAARWKISWTGRVHAKAQLLISRQLNSPSSTTTTPRQHSP